MFVELLRARFARLPAAERDAVHARAARWLANDGRLVEAMRHAIAGGQWDLAGSLAADGWLDAFLVGRSAALRSVLGELPPEFAEREPAIAIALAAVNLELGELDRADGFLEQARAAIGKRQRDAGLSGLLALVTLQRARSRGDLAGAVTVAGELLASGASRTQPPERRALALLLLGSSEIWTGDARAASRHLRASIALARRFEQPYLLLGGLGNLALLQVVEGRLEAGIELAEEALELATEGGWDEVPQSAPARLHSGGRSCTEPTRWLRRRSPWPTPPPADRATRRSSWPPPPCRHWRAWMRPGGPRRGLEMVRGAIDEAGDQPLPVVLARLLRTIEVRLLVAAREDREAAAAIAAAPPCVATSVLAARRALAVGDTEAARELLEPVLDQRGGAGRHGEPDRGSRRLRGRVPRPARSRRGRRRAGARPRAGRPRPVRLGVPAGRAAAARPAHPPDPSRHEPPRARRDAVASSWSATPRAHAPQPLLEPLSEREQRVLSYLETMLSTEEIAGELFVSTNTVKSHVKSIYRKLGVTRRRQAVLRARTLQLL